MPTPKEGSRHHENWEGCWGCWDCSHNNLEPFKAGPGAHQKKRNKNKMGPFGKASTRKQKNKKKGPLACMVKPTRPEGVQVRPTLVE